MLLKSVLVWQNNTTSSFSVSLKFGACYITGQWGEFKIKKATLCFHSFFFFFFFIWWGIKFLQKNKKGLGGTKLSVELYVKRQNRNSYLMSPGSRILGTHFRYPESEWFSEQRFRKMGNFTGKNWWPILNCFWKSFFDRHP